MSWKGGKKEGKEYASSLFMNPVVFWCNNISEHPVHLQGLRVGRMSGVAAFPGILPTLNPCRYTLEYFCVRAVGA